MDERRVDSRIERRRHPLRARNLEVLHRASVSRTFFGRPYFGARGAA
jgi:hypothetical protein